MSSENVIRRMKSEIRKLKKSRDLTLFRGNHLAKADVFCARMNGEIAGLERAISILEGTAS